MKKSGFYLLKNEYVNLVNSLGGRYADKKERPIYCCIEDNKIPGLYWAIPTSDISHRTDEQMNRITSFCNLPSKDIRSAYYHIGTTNRPAIFKISSALPITDKYIEKEYISQGTHLMLGNKAQIEQIQNKLHKILSYEGRFPNRLEQHITDVKAYLIKESALSAAESLPFPEVTAYSTALHTAEKESPSTQQKKKVPTNFRREEKDRTWRQPGR